MAEPFYLIPSRIDRILGADVYEQITTQKLPMAGGLGLSVTKFVSILTGSVPTDQPFNLKSFHLLDDYIQIFWQIQKVPIVLNYMAEELDCEEFFMQTPSRGQNGCSVVKTTIQGSQTITGSP